VSNILHFIIIVSSQEWFQCVDPIFACLTKIVCHICVCGLKGAIKGMSLRSELGGGGSTVQGETVDLQHETSVDRASHSCIESH
jgi:hypothetical protein